MVQESIVQVLGVGMVVVVGVGTHSCHLTNCCQQTDSDNTISMVIYALYIYRERYSIFSVQIKVVWHS